MVYLYRSCMHKEDELDMTDVTKRLSVVSQPHVTRSYITVHSKEFISYVTNFRHFKNYQIFV